MASTGKYKPVIGLTGGIGSGKSAVASHFASLGCAVIDSDELARNALKIPETIRKIAEIFGQDLLDESGLIDNRKLATLVFNDADKLKQLEDLIHPQVHHARQQLRERYLADDRIPAIVEDCPLLIEKGLDKDCDVVIFVDSDRDIRLQRVADNRGWTSEQLEDREKNQTPLDIKANHADYVIKNNAGTGDCLTHVRRVFYQIMKNQ